MSAPPDPRRLWHWVLGWSVAALVLLFIVIQFGRDQHPTTKTLSYSQLHADVAAGQVRLVTIHQKSGKIEVELRSGALFVAQGPPGGLADADIALLDAKRVPRDYVSETANPWWGLLGTLLPIALIVGFWVWFMRRSRTAFSQGPGDAGFTKSRARVQDGKQPGTTFDDIAGYESVKEEIAEVVSFLKDPTPFLAIGAKVPKGVLLIGPPGTGKTLFAKAIAGEAGVPFISISGSEFLEMFVGVGAARVRDLFKQAREHNPSIVFVDEIDAIGRKRGTGIGTNHDEREQTLNQLLAELDGFDTAQGIVVLAATNRPDVLDPALLRAGRFDRQVVIPLPTGDERRAILAVHTRGMRMAADVDLGVTAAGTPGMSGAELANLVNEAALIAVRHGGTQVAAADLDAARDRVMLGLRRTSLALGPEEKEIVAYHEAGHGLVAALLPQADPVHKITILPTGMSLGSTQQMPLEERQLRQQPYIEDALAVRLAGRAAEQLVYGMASTGAHDDLVGATSLARRMVREWGMTDRLGHMAWGSQEVTFLGEDLVQTRDYSDATAQVIDAELTRILDEQSARAADVLRQHRPELDALAHALLERETLEAADVKEIMEAAAAQPDRPPLAPSTA